MSLQAKLDEISRDFEKKAPPEIVKAMKKATDDLAKSGLADRALKKGDMAPSFVLPDENGTSVDSAELLKRGPLVVTFYRGVWCPYCNLDLEAIEAAAGKIRELGASLVVISPQTAANSRKAREKHNLSFPVLSDQGGRVADAFRIRFTLAPEIVPIYKGFGVDLEQVNSDPSWTLPMPARFLIDQSGKIIYAEVNPDYTHRPDPDEVIAALRDRTG